MDRSKQIVRVSIVGILANLVLVAFKAAVGLITGSIAVTLDALNNLSDALSSVITILGTRLANRPPDKKHPYGYGRIEHISSVTIAVIVLLAGVTSFRESLLKIIHPEAANYSVASLVIIGVAVLVKVFLGRYVKKRGEALSSESLVASGTDALFDAIISFSTLVAAAVSLIWGLSIEGFLGVVISVIILKAGLEILLESLSSIIGARVDRDLSVLLKRTIAAYDGVNGAYDLTLHRYGPEKTIGSVHVEVPDSMTARDIHRLSHRIMEDIYRDFGIVLTVGIYAANTENAFAAEMRRKASEIAVSHKGVLQLHGFYLEERDNRVSFDLVVAFGSDTERIFREVCEELTEIYPDYTFQINADVDYSD